MMKLWKVVVGLLLTAVLVGACGGEGGGAGAGSIARTYSCHFEGDPETPVVVYELAGDGTFTIHSFDEGVDSTTGTWSEESGEGVLMVEGEERAFVVEGGRLTFRQAPPSDWFVLTYQPPASVTGFTCFPEDSSGGGDKELKESGGGPIARTYDCTLPDGTPVSTIELLDDGTGTITILNSEGGVEATFDITWAAEGDGGSIGPGTPDEDPFRIQDGSLVFGDGLTCPPAG